MVDFLGWFNVVLVTLSISLFVTRRTNKILFRNKNIILRKFSLFLSKAHPGLGMLLVITGITHGYLALGTIKLHTGMLIWLSIVAMALEAVLGNRYELRWWVKLHRYTTLLVIASVIIHLVAI